LASSFFAILLKQAFREYKSWTEVPRTLEALRLRQLRFDAFTSWKVSDAVAAMPALLELAVVLFMTGLPLFLWNLNLTLALVVTVTVGAFLSISAAAATLPALTPDFPYKSPVGWGFWKVKFALTRLFPWRASHRSSLPFTNSSKQARKSMSLNEKASSTWRQRDLRISKVNEHAHLWNLIQWFCTSWSDHRLAHSVRGCMIDLIYGSNALKSAYSNYIDVVEVGVPSMMGETTRMWTLLVSTCGIPKEVFHLGFPDARSVKLEEAQSLRQRLVSLPWKMLAIVSDELVAGLRVAVRQGFNSPMYLTDADRTRAIVTLCLLECLFEPAKAAGLEVAYTESWLALFCDICCHHKTSSIPIGVNNWESGRVWTLEDIMFPWFERRVLQNLSRDSEYADFRVGSYSQ
jgi:hypothetical protein